MEEQKPFWELIYDNYLEHKNTIMGICIIGSIMSMSLKIRNLEKTNTLLQTQLQSQIDNLKIENNFLTQTIKQIDKDNKNIVMWFAQGPKFNKPRNY